MLTTYQILYILFLQLFGVCVLFFVFVFFNIIYHKLIFIAISLNLRLGLHFVRLTRQNPRILTQSMLQSFMANYLVLKRLKTWTL